MGEAIFIVMDRNILVCEILMFVGLADGLGAGEEDGVI